MLIVVLVGFALAVAAPWLPRLLGRWTGWGTALLPLSVAVYLASFITVVSEGQSVVQVVPWIPSLGIALSFYLDGLSLTFALLISGIGTLVFVYTGGYLAGDRDLGRFYAFILAFMSSMLGLVLSSNLITLFVFWELTSLTSYFLIGFDNGKSEARAAALQALLVTGAGGLLLLPGLLLLGQLGGSFEFSEILMTAGVVRGDPLYIPTLLLILAGAFSKSAQFPFHFWLPNAMAAPTPASAYLHSSTMVTAGIYLLARLHPVLGGTETWLAMLTTFGAATMVAAALLALRETHMKRVLAYTTVSALGVLTMLLGIGSRLSITAAMTFLVVHAFYKAALFLVAGAVDHETGERDLEKLAGLFHKMPITASAALLAALSMAGVIPLFGFLAKELMFEATWDAPVQHLLLTVAALLTSIWIVACAAMIGLKPFVGAVAPTPKRPHEAPPSLWLGPVVLASLGLAAGLAPHLIDKSLIGPAVSAVVGQPTEVRLAVWHGPTLSLALDIVALAGGGVFFVCRGNVRRAFSRCEAIIRWGPDRWYQVALRGLNAVARGQTRIIQSGYLRYYLMTIVVTLVLLVGFTLFWHGGGLPATMDWSGVQLQDVGLAAVILLATLAAVRSKSRLGAIAALGVVGYGMGLLFVLFSAPDLAITQFIIETLTVIVFVLVFYHLRKFEDLTSKATRCRDAVIALAAGALMTIFVLIATGTQWHRSISDYFVINSKSRAHGQNVVNVILVDFRGIDTLGEITVLAMAGIGVYALLKLRLGENEEKEA